MSILNLSLLGIIITLALLMVLVFKRVNIIPATIVSCVVLALFSNINILNILSGNYLEAMAKFIASNFLIFASSALFGKVMEDSGCSAAIANWICAKFGTRHAVYGGMLASALLSYGGVSVFVIAFAVLPIFLHIFQQANLPRRLLPGVIFSSSCTFAAAMLPGAAQLNNVIPTQYLHTTPMAAPLIGIIPSIVTAILIFLYFEYEIKKAKKMGMGFDATEETLKSIEKYNSVKPVNALVSFIPIIALFVLMNILNVNIFVSMLGGSLLCFIIGWRNISSKLTTLNQGIGSVTTAVINTASVVGLGGAIQATSGFEALIGFISNFGGNPLIALSVATTLVSGAAGTGGGGTGIAMQVFAENFLNMGLDPEIIHRVVSISSLGLSFLPHNGVGITILSLTGFTHKEAYMPMFWSTLVPSIVAMIIAVALGIIIYPI